MFYRVHDLNTEPETSYVVARPDECKDQTDRSAVTEAIKFNDVITMGKVIVEPITEPNVAEIDAYKEVYVYQCMDCGAMAWMRGELKHHGSCRPGESEYWEHFYSKEDRA